jgi:hypothetical protein
MSTLSHEKYSTLSEENKKWLADGRTQFFEKYEETGQLKRYTDSLIQSFREMEDHIDYYHDGPKRRGTTIYKGNYFLPCFECHSVTCLCWKCYDKKCYCNRNIVDYGSAYRNSHTSMDEHGVGSW